MIEVLKQALEALYSISHNSTDDYRGQADKAIASLRQAIAELESQDGVCQYCAGKGCVACDARKQEPVGEVSDHDWSTGLLYRDLAPGTHLYTHPPQRTWQGLTDEEIDKAWRSVDYTVPWEQHRIDIAKAIEAKLKERNI